MWKYDENGQWTLVPEEREPNSGSSPYYYVPETGNDWRPTGASQTNERNKTFNRWKNPLLFYGLTWLSTTFVGAVMYGNGSMLSGLWFSIPLMIILTAHECGHYIQARRYRVEATLPLFIPIPLPPFGTLGAVIRMDARIPNIRALYDIGISGPLAGLIPSFLFLFIGVALSKMVPVEPSKIGLLFGEPLLFQWVSNLFFDRSIPGMELSLHPIGMAAWTGLFITSLNLFPLGQLDGGHVFYALLKRKAALFSRLLFYLLVFMVILLEQWNWTLMVLLILFFGVDHQPTCDDSLSLGRFRTVLGWLTLAFLFIGFTPNPIQEPPTAPAPPVPRSKTIYSDHVLPIPNQESPYVDIAVFDTIQIYSPYEGKRS